MIRVSEAAYRLSAFASLVLCGSGLAQQADVVSFEADSVTLDLRGSGSVYTGLTVTDGTITIHAAEATRSSDDDDLWELRGGLRIAIETTTLTADRGTLRVADGKLAEIELLGEPVTLEGPAGGESRQLRLTAGRIAYDGAQRVLSASEEVVFVSDGLEVRNCSWTYDLSDKSVQATAETSDKCRARLAMSRAPR